MKISVIITTILVAQVSASFFDVFHGAVLSVQNGFGKLLSDVVTDVKDTVDCTILAVEHVLSLSPDATARYYDKCGTNKTDSVSEARQDASLPKVEVTLNLPNNEEFLQKVIPAEIDEKINETLSKVLDNYKSHDNVLSIERVLAKESELLAGVSGLVKKELEKLSNEVTTDLKNIDKQRNSQPSVDTILQEIKVLEKRELITKNTTEANEIHQVIVQLLGKLDAIEVTEATENVKLEEILKELENKSNNSFVGLRHKFEQWKEEESRHLNEIKSKIEKHEKISDLHNGSYNRHGSNQTGSVLFIKDMKSDDVGPISSYSETSSNNTTLIKDILDNSTSSRTFGNGKSLISVANDVSFSQNKTFEYSGVNDTVKTSNSYFDTERSSANKIIHPFESPTTVGSSELSRSVNQSTTPKNNITTDDTKETVKRTALGITDKTPLNENSQAIDISTESEKQKPLAIREPTVTIFSTIEKNSSETLIMSNPKQGLEIEDVKLHVKSKNHSIKELSFDSAKNNDTIIRSAAETEMTAISQNENNLNDIVITNKSDAVVKNIYVNATNPVNVVSSTVTTIIVQDSDDSDDSKITSTTLPIVKYAPVSENIQPVESTTASSKEETTTTVVYYNHSNDVVITSTLQTVQNLFIRKNIQIEESSNTIRNNTMVTSSPTPITSPTTPMTTSSIVESTTIKQTIEPIETNMAFGNEASLNTSNESIITITPLPIIENTLVSDTFEVIELITTSKIENDSYTTITSPTPIVSISESENIQAINITTIFSSKEKSIDLTATETLATADDDDLSVSIVTSTSDTISESKINVAASESKETIIMDRFTHTDSDSITSAPLPLTEITTVSEIIDLVESTTSTENEEPTILTTKPATIPDEVKNENTGSNDTVASTKKNMEIIQKVETITASEEQDLSSTSKQSAINEIVTTSITLPPTDRIPISEEDLGNLPRLEANPFLRTPNIPDLNYSIKSPPLTVTESSPVTRKWMTPNELNQRNYNTSGEPGNDYDYKVSKSLSDRSLQTRQPLINPEVPYKKPIYSQPVVSPIIRGLFKNKLQDADEFASFDAMDEQLVHPVSPVGNNIAITNIPLIPGLTNPPRMNLENPSFVPPLYSILPPLSFDDKASEKTDRPPGLTTHIPRIPESRANNYKSSSIDYDSFFHMPPRNSEAHKRALKEALQLMANSKRTDRIVNNIMKNKNKFNARSIFNG